MDSRDGSRSKRIGVALAALVFAITLTGCHPSSNVTRCDNLIAAQEETVANIGGWLRCDPSYDRDEQSHCPPSYRCQFVMEWDKFIGATRVPIAWVWQANLTDYWLQIAAFEGVCETYAYRAGRIPDYYLTVQRDGVPAAIDKECFSWAVAQAA